MPTLDALAAVFTIVGGTLALLQLTAILIRLNRRPRLQIKAAAVHEVDEAGRHVVTLQIVTSNTGSLSARSVLWNYDLPSGFGVLSADVEHHVRDDRVTVVRALEHLHPRVEAHHELALETPTDVRSFNLGYRIHLEDARPLSGSMVVEVRARG